MTKDIKRKEKKDVCTRKRKSPILKLDKIQNKVKDAKQETKQERIEVKYVDQRGETQID